MPAIIIPAADNVSLKGEKEVAREKKCLALYLGYHLSDNHAMQHQASDTLEFSVTLSCCFITSLPCTHDSVQIMENGHHPSEDLPQISGEAKGLC